MPKMLVIAGDTWHSPEIVSRGLEALPDSAIDFDLITAPKDILTPAFIRAYPIILCCKGNVISTGEPWFDANVAELNPRDFHNYVKEGGCFIALHAGTSYYNDVTRIESFWKKPNEDYMDLIGARFLGHPPRCPVSHNVVSSHPIMKGVNNFTERDEHYQLDVFANDIQPLFTTSSIPGGQNRIGGYLRETGKGVVIVLTPGHTFSVWKNPNYQKILTNTFSWCLNRNKS